MASWLSTLRSRNRVHTPGWLLRSKITPYRPRRLHTRDAIPPVTKVEKILLDNIKATGPVTFASYTQLCLSHPTYGYYMNSSNPVFGTQGDFITSPEISQIFGELIGIWLLSQWLSVKPHSSHLRLIELGPGRGTLLADVLRVVHKFAPARQLQDVHLVETSLAMRDLQHSKLKGQADQQGFNLHWHSSIDEIPHSENFSMVLAHEFFDALPFHVLQKVDNEWQEVMIASNLDPIQDPRSHPETASASKESSSGVYPRFRRVLSPMHTAASLVLGPLSPRFQSLPTGSTVEISPASFKISRKVAELLSTSNPGDRSSGGGCGLIIDYGSAKAFGDSFRAFKDHKLVDVFHQPGECDLTTNVDFAFLQEAMGDLVSTHGPISQSAFLENMGLRLRLSRLLENAGTDERRSAIQGAADRLVDPTGMGTQYQVMGITSKGNQEAEKEVFPFLKTP